MLDYKKLSVERVYKIQRSPRFTDKRGVIDTFWNKDLEETIGNIAEHKFSFSRKGTFRGMHAEYAAWKSMTVIYGVVQFCFIDLYEPTQVTSLIVSEKDCITFTFGAYIANGHTALTDCCMMYSLCEPYNINNQISISYKSPEIAEHLWLSKIDENLISERDLNAPTLLQWQTLQKKPL